MTFPHGDGVGSPGEVVRRGLDLRASDDVFISEELTPMTRRFVVVRNGVRFMGGDLFHRGKNSWGYSNIGSCTTDPDQT